MSYFRTDGTPTGYTYTYMEKLSEYTGWKIEYIPYNSGDENKDIQDAMEDLESGKVDLFGPLLKNQQSREKYLFPQRSYGTVYTVLYALKTSDLRVGLLKDADTVAWRFSVTDTGIGMNGDFQQQMFDPFTQEHGENRSEFKGTGLGLSIVKRIVEQMGGKEEWICYH